MNDKTQQPENQTMEKVVSCDETHKLHYGGDPNPASDRENKINETDSALATENHERARKIICDSIRERQAAIQFLEDSLDVPPVVEDSLKSTPTPNFNWEKR
jgi:4-hydroxy-3-methylbut-2-enyl diphosphate reductase IspH